MDGLSKIEALVPQGWRLTWEREECLRCFVVRAWKNGNKRFDVQVTDEMRHAIGDDDMMTHMAQSFIGERIIAQVKLCDEMDAANTPGV